MQNDTKVTTAVLKVTNLNKEDLEYVRETATYINLCLILFTLIIIKIAIIKFVKICGRIYLVHKERVIRQHNEAQQQI